MPEKVPELGGWSKVRRRRRRHDVSKQEEQAPGERQVGDKMSIMTTIEPEGLRPMTAVEEWEEVEFGVDSGATETVVGRQTLAWMEAKEGVAFKRGKIWNGQRGRNRQRRGKGL